MTVDDPFTAEDIERNIAILKSQNPTFRRSIAQLYADCRFLSDEFEIVLLVRPCYFDMRCVSFVATVRGETSLWSIDLDYFDPETHELELASLPRCVRALRLLLEAAKMSLLFK